MRSNRLFFKHLVIGGGVVGLSVARSLVNAGEKNVLLVDRGKWLGSEMSSRNSEVIHSGIYYPKNSLKTELCIKGAVDLYSILQKQSLPYKKIGKWIVSNTPDDPYLMSLYDKSKDLGLNSFHFLPEKQFSIQEPFIKAKTVLVSPETGILDSHALLQFLEGVIVSNDGEILLNANVTAIEEINDGYQSLVLDRLGNTIEIESKTVINSGGMNAVNVRNLFFDDEKKYSYTACKGTYWRFPNTLGNGNNLCNRLIYPVPPKDLTSLGIHTTLDLSGRLRLGPDAEMGKDDLIPDENGRERFWEGMKSYFRLKDSDISKLSIDYSGVRCKLSSTSFSDFIIEEEKKGFINLLGIESPGLTSSLAIGGYVENILRKGNFIEGSN
jgi:2-hydroxyglutarate dehydrogenase